MTQLEFVNVINVLLSTRKLDLGADQKEAMWNLKEIHSILVSYYKRYIMEQLQKEECPTPGQTGMDSWYEYFLAADGENTAVFQRVIFTEEDCDRIWKDAHPQE